MAPSSIIVGSDSARGEIRRKCHLILAFGALALLGATSQEVSAQAYSLHAPPELAATEYYKKALRGASCAPASGRESPAFQRLARLHYHAVRLRHAKDFSGACAVYRRFLAMQQSGELPKTEEVQGAVAAAHASLNWALTEQAQKSFDAARQVFQSGVARVQELIRIEFKARVDGQHQVHLGDFRSSADDQRRLQQALAWLATLLTAWALLETKRGKVLGARHLVQRAACLDSRKAPLLRWKLLKHEQEDCSEAETASSC